jgi:hypothetical protein
MQKKLYFQLMHTNMLHNLDNDSVESNVSVPSAWSNDDYSSGDKVTAIIPMLNPL